MSCPVHAGFDPLSETFLRDPLAERPAAPVFYAPSLDYYVITRYADIERVFLDPETFSAANAQLPLIALAPEVGKTLLDGGHKPQPSMVSLDPPQHGRLRKPAARAFTPRRVREMEPRIGAITAELLDAVDDDPFDLIAALAFPLPMRIIFSFMGVPEADWARLKEWCGSRASLAWGRPTPDEALHHAQQMVRYRRYLRELVAAKSQERGDDFASALLEIHDEDPGALTHEEIASILFSLSFAGHETTNNLIGNCVRRLLEVPDRWARLVSEQDLIEGAVDKILRFDPSVPVWRRVTTKPVTLGGVDLPQGAKLFLWLAAAGRDADVFPEPDAFDPTRDNARRTLAFGRGIHFCIGSALGRLEATLALAELTRRFPRLRLVPEQEIPFHPNISFRGPQALWVTHGSRSDIGVSGSGALAVGFRPPFSEVPRT
jgi:cytochrome P450